MSDDADSMSTARNEVLNTLSICNFFTSIIAISFRDKKPDTFTEKMKISLWYFFCTFLLIALVGSEFVYLAYCLVGDTSMATFVATLHIVGYGCISVCKCIMIWFKQSVFREVVNELVELWPVKTEDEETAELKRSSVTTLRLVQICYVAWTMGGFMLYNLPPVGVYLYHLARDEPADLGFVWTARYPFDKTKPVIHELVYVFEICSGMVAVSAMLGSDLMFTGMASHICMLLRILQIKIRGIGHAGNNKTDSTPQSADRNLTHSNIDCYDDIVSVIKVHQRLISYCQDLEEVFSLVNLVNVLLSSVNICCAVFNIVVRSTALLVATTPARYQLLLEPWTEMRDKFFLGAAMTQVGLICWYADDIFRASVGVSDAVYSSGWYNTNPRCRRALLLLLQRSQKPLYFTAFKFRSITMATYSSILTTSYSYFALLYTMYSN